MIKHFVELLGIEIAVRHWSISDKVLDMLGQNHVLPDILSVEIMNKSIKWGLLFKFCQASVRMSESPTA